ncbi:hypothetical protein F5144DRAFT_337529 [Chaetomium tenue]|uniref:Uncharacterized protein n=1 Tax=Chaetomium tenue TaxID=1854479 RepID=A0ACB7P139_9PEZI|nr:hypothetical protein F5144DRAFT_337529 [Chaetomium globosum]
MQRNGIWKPVFLFLTEGERVGSSSMVCRLWLFDVCVCMCVGGCCGWLGVVRRGADFICLASLCLPQSLATLCPPYSARVAYLLDSTHHPLLTILCSSTAYHTAGGTGQRGLRPPAAGWWVVRAAVCRIRQHWSYKSNGRGVKEGGEHVAQWERLCVWVGGKRGGSSMR